MSCFPCLPNDSYPELYRSHLWKTTVRDQRKPTTQAQGWSRSISFITRQFAESSDNLRKLRATRGGSHRTALRCNPKNSSITSLISLVRGSARSNPKKGHLVQDIDTDLDKLLSSGSSIICSSDEIVDRGLRSGRS